MIAYYDTGILLKLYTEESESPSVRNFVLRRNAPLFINALHHSECTSALRLKAFRGECTEDQASRAFSHIADDLKSGVLREHPIDWGECWGRCRALSDAHAATTGRRTLDALHVACALLSPAKEFISSDTRQSALARRAGLVVTNPTTQK